MHKVSRRATQSLLAHSHDKKRWPTASSSFLRLPDPGDRRQCGARRARARRSGAARRAGFRRDDRDLARGYHPPQSQSRHPRRPFGVARRASGGARGAGGHLRDDSRRAADVVSLFSRRSLPASETGPRQPGAADTSAVRPRQSAARRVRPLDQRVHRQAQELGRASMGGRIQRGATRPPRVARHARRGPGRVGGVGARGRRHSTGDRGLRERRSRGIATRRSVAHGLNRWLVEAASEATERYKDEVATFVAAQVKVRDTQHAARTIEFSLGKDLQCVLSVSTERWSAVCWGS